MNRQEIQRVLDNPMTPQLVEWVEKMKSMTGYLVSPQFFHKTHSKRDREVLIKLLQNFYPTSEFIRHGDDGVTINFK